MSNKIYYGVDEFLEDHDCKNWSKFREFVQFATDNVADVGYIGGDSNTERWEDENLNERNGIFFITSDETSQILFFPFSFEDFDSTLNQLKIFKN